METPTKSETQMRCPHCHAELTLREAITILNGTGFVRRARVRLEDGRIIVLEASKINPNTVEILD